MQSRTSGKIRLPLHLARVTAFAAWIQMPFQPKTLSEDGIGTHARNGQARGTANKRPTCCMEALSLGLDPQGARVSTPLDDRCVGWYPSGTRALRCLSCFPQGKLTYHVRAPRIMRQTSLALKYPRTRNYLGPDMSWSSPTWTEQGLFMFAQPRGPCHLCEESRWNN